MNKKTKNKIIQVIVKSGLVFSVITLMISIMLALIYGEQFYLVKIWVVIWLIISCISLCLIGVFPYAIETPKVKAFRFPLKICNYNDFIKYLDENVSLIGYDKFQYFNNNKELSYVYWKKAFDILEYYTIYHFDEIKESKAKTLNYCDNLLEGFFEMYYHDKKRNDFFRETCILWVDKETKYFEDIINTNLSQGKYDGLLIIGISPSKQLIYVANQKDGNNKFLYWKLRKKFLKVMNLKMKDRIRNK